MGGFDSIQLNEPEWTKVFRPLNGQIWTLRWDWIFLKFEFEQFKPNWHVYLFIIYLRWLVVFNRGYAKS